MDIDSLISHDNDTNTYGKSRRVDKLHWTQLFTFQKQVPYLVLKEAFKSSCFIIEPKFDEILETCTKTYTLFKKHLEVLKPTNGSYRHPISVDAFIICIPIWKSEIV